MKYETAAPYIASYVILRKNGKVAFVLRSNTSWMDGYYGLPAGKVEKGETFSAAAVREAKEEVGVTIKESDIKHAVTVHRASDKAETIGSNSWVDMFFEVAIWEGEPHNAEPEKHSALEWLDPDNLPSNVAPPIAVALQAIKGGKSYVEYGWNTN